MSVISDLWDAYMELMAHECLMSKFSTRSPYYLYGLTGGNKKYKYHIEVLQRVLIAIGGMPEYEQINQDVKIRNFDENHEADYYADTEKRVAGIFIYDPETKQNYHFVTGGHYYARPDYCYTEIMPAYLKKHGQDVLCINDVDLLKIAMSEELWVNLKNAIQKAISNYHIKKEVFEQMPLTGHETLCIHLIDEPDAWEMTLEAEKIVNPDKQK